MENKFNLSFLAKTILIEVRFGKSNKYTIFYNANFFQISGKITQIETDVKKTYLSNR